MNPRWWPVDRAAAKAIPAARYDRFDPARAGPARIATPPWRTASSGRCWLLLALPAAGWLLIGGLGSLIAIRRRKKAA
jgi:hypothetical protein